MKPNLGFCRVFILRLLLYSNIFCVFRVLSVIEKLLLVYAQSGTVGASAWMQELPLCLKYPCSIGTLSSLSSVLWREGCPWEQLYLCGTFLILCLSPACCCGLQHPFTLCLLLWWITVRVVEHPELEGTHGESLKSSSWDPSQEDGISLSCRRWCELGATVWSVIGRREEYPGRKCKVR